MILFSDFVMPRYRGAPYIHGFLAHRLSNWATRPLKHDRCDKKMQFLGAPVIYLVFRSGRINCAGNILLWGDVGQMWEMIKQNRHPRI
jgi:hypothetical protein